MWSLYLAPSFAGKCTAPSLVPPPWQPQLGAGLVSNPLPLSLCRGKDSLCSGDLGPPVLGEGGGEREAAGAQHVLPGFAGSPKKQLQGQRGACCPNQPWGGFMGPTAASGGTRIQSRMCCSSWQPNRPIPMLAMSPWGVPAPAGLHLQLTDAILPAPRVVSWSHRSVRTTHPSPSANAPSSPLSHGALGQVTASCGTLLTPAQAQKRTSRAPTMAQTRFFSLL